MSEAIHVLGVSGSLRRGSFNTGLLRAAAGLLPEGMTLEIFDLAPIPLFNADLEAGARPEPVEAFRTCIRTADALLIACPEYNYSISGVLKNAIDWASRSKPGDPQPLDGKPAAIMGAGGRLGTGRAQYHLRQVAVFVNLLLLNRPEVMVQSADQHFDAGGTLTDERTRKQIRALLDALAAWTRRLRAG